MFTEIIADVLMWEEEREASPESKKSPRQNEPKKEHAIVIKIDQN